MVGSEVWLALEQGSTLFCAVRDDLGRADGAGDHHSETGDHHGGTEDHGELEEEVSVEPVEHVA